MSEIKPGVYLSDVVGHLLILKKDPVSVTCVSCVETCDRSKFRGMAEFAGEAANFVSKHGALDRWIAEDIGEIVEYYLAYLDDFIEKTKASYEEMLAIGKPVINIIDPFDISPETYASLDIEPEKK